MKFARMHVLVCITSEFVSVCTSALWEPIDSVAAHRGAHVSASTVRMTDSLMYDQRAKVHPLSV